jgi:hypothetical protein
MKNFILAVLFLSTFSAQALTNSTFADEPDFGTVVLLKNEALDEDGNSAPGYCVGTVISANIIVTAAHCLAQAEALGKKETAIQFGYYKYIQKPSGERVRIGYKTSHEIIDRPQFKFLPSVTDKIRRQGTKAVIAPGEDIAHIVLSKALDLAALAIKPTPVVQMSEWNGMKNILTQYVPTVVTVNPIAEITTNDTKRKATLNNLKVLGLNIESRSGSRVEMGDSGSPLFVRISNEWKLVAVTKGVAKGYFDNWDMFTVVPGTL